MNILLIDNYDSFTYNLAQYLGEVGPEPDVRRNDEIETDAIEDLDPDGIVISPGPGTPSDAGISLKIIKQFGDEIPILGVCLGHQCIAEALGGKVERADRLLHGKTSKIYHNGQGVYESLPEPVEATRYHSLLVDEDSLPSSLMVDALTKENEIMGFHHVKKPLIGVQFHPESILTEQGRKMISNFLDFVKSPQELGESERPTIPSQSEDDSRVKN